MALIGRLFAILFGFLAACFVAGMIVVIALLYPEFTDLGIEPPDPDTLNLVLGFGFIFVSGFALVPAMILVLVTEAFYIRGILAYAAGGAIAARPVISASSRSIPRPCISKASCGATLKS